MNEIRKTSVTSTKAICKITAGDKAKTAVRQVADSWGQFGLTQSWSGGCQTGWAAYLKGIIQVKKGGLWQGGESSSSWEVALKWYPVACVCLSLLVRFSSMKRGGTHSLDQTISSRQRVKYKNSLKYQKEYIFLADNIQNIVNSYVIITYN